MKKLIVFMFSVVLLGSCSKEKTVKFSIERTSSEPTFGTQGGSFYVNLSYDYLGGAGVSQISGGLTVGHRTPNWNGAGWSGVNSSFSESDLFTMIKNDNVSLSLGYLGYNCDYSGYYDIKAHVGRKEYIIKENYFRTSGNGSESINWIVP
tara:strand:+ start:279 stop:728 length:450 start_codon:yes stop_codon:yes gene_type:complete